MSDLPIGQELLLVHHQLRARLDVITNSLELGGPEAGVFATSCLAFCRALRRHHVGETDEAFRVVRRHVPELEEVLAALVRDHEFLDPMLDRVEAMVAGLDVASDPALQHELDGLAAVLANHLAYEERMLVDLLDRLPIEQGSDDDQALRAPLDGIFEKR